MVIYIFWFCLTRSLPKNLDFYDYKTFTILIITQALKMNKLRTTSAKSIIADTIRKLAKHSLKNFLGKGNVYFHQFQDIVV